MSAAAADPPGDPPENALKNWDYVGRSYNLLEVDLLDPGSQSKVQVFSVTAFYSTPDGTYKVPAGFDYNPASGGKSQKSTKVITSSYDFKTSFSASLALDASDVTGSLYSATLSGSYKETSDRTATEEKTLTISDEILNVYRIQCSTDLSSRKLNDDISSALGSLPEVYDGTTKNAFASFFESYGTHYGSGAVMGGRAFQRLTIDNASYTSLVTNAVDVSVQASATFDIVKLGEKASSNTTISKQFAEAVQDLNEDVTWVGGVPQPYGAWYPSVPLAPAPVTLQLTRLSDLLVRAYFPTLPAIDNRRQALSDAIDDYLKAHGQNDYEREVVRFGDSIRVLIDGKTQLMALVANRDGEVSLQPNGPELAGSEWIVCELPPAASGDVISLPGHGSQVVGLKNALNGLLLDAMWGQSGEYMRGDGLVACHGVDLTTPSGRWSITRAAAETRSTLVSNDLVRLQTQWTNQDGEMGFLMGGTDSHSTDAFSFGPKEMAVNTVWRLRKV